ncbi:MAG: hypothetical protein WBL25_08700 [Anaerolineales bacterium]
MAETDLTRKPKGVMWFLGSDLILGFLVAFLSILTALAAYQGSIADSQESDLNVAGQKQLTEANSFYLEANQFVLYDYNLYDGWYITDDPEVADYFYDNFSEELTASMDRSEGPFDDEYYDSMYAGADDLYDEAIDYFDQAQAAGERAIQMQLIVLVFAVGLALAAYASLIQSEKRIRIVFAIASILALIMGLFSYMTA